MYRYEYNISLSFGKNSHKISINGFFFFSNIPVNNDRKSVCMYI